MQVGATLSIEGPMERHSRSTSLPITTARRAWQINGKWYAIRPMLRRDPELGGHDGV